jgi:hypothetical protein
MGAHYTCDFCGEPITGRSGRDFVTLYSFHPWFPQRDLHASPCLGLLNEVVAEACSHSPERRRREEQQQREAEWREQEQRWRSLSNAQRERLLIELLAEDRLTVSELVEKVRDKFGRYAVAYGDVYPVVKRLQLTGELSREEETFRKTRKRWRYFRRPMAGPIADLERAFNGDEGAS